MSIRCEAAAGWELHLLGYAPNLDMTCMPSYNASSAFVQACLMQRDVQVEQPQAE